MLYFRMFLVMGVALYTSRIVLAQLGIVDYGIYSVVGSIVVMLSSLNGAMSLSTVRFLSFAHGREDMNGAARVFRSAITIHILLSLIILLLAETLGLWFLNNFMRIPSHQMTSANWVYQCIVISFIFSIIQTLANAVVIAREKMEIFAVLSVVEVVMKLIVALSLTFIPANKLKAYALLNLCAVMVFTILSMIYCRRCFAECRSFRAIYDRDIFRTMAGFMSWSTFGSFSWVGKNQGCNILLNIFYGPVVNAAYAISSQVNAALTGFVQNFSTAVNPQIIKTFSAGETSRTESLIITGSKISFYLLLLLSFPILIATQPILRIWLGTYPAYTPVFVQLVIVNSLIESFTYSISAGVRATGRVKVYEIMVGGVQLLNLPIAYILLRNGMPPQSVLVMIAIISGIALFIRLWLLKKYIPAISISAILHSVFLPACLLVIVCAGLYVGCRELEVLQHIHPVITIFGSMLIVVILEVGVGLNASERKFLSQAVLRHIPALNGHSCNK